MSPDSRDPLDLNRLSALTARALDAARAAGAEAADAVAVAAIRRSVTLRNGVMEEMESAEGTDLGLRVFVGARNALVRASAAADLAESAERAVAMARAAPEDESQRLADPAETIGEPADLDLNDGAAPEVEALTDRARELEAAMREVPGITNSGGASAAVARSARFLATSRGFAAGYVSGLHRHGVTAIAGEGTRMERDYWASAARHLSDLHGTASVGTRAGERAVRRMDADKLSTRTATIVFEPRVAASFLGHLVSAVNGSAVARGASFLAGRDGELVFGEGITIGDDPHTPRGLASRPFDGEGLPGEPIDIVRAGELRAYLLDLATAHRLGRTSNGRASRGTGAPSPGASNVAVRGGSGDLSSLMVEAGSGLLVTDLIGRPADIVSGNYSCGAAGLWFEGGEVAHPVAEITIAGSLRDMFANAVFADDAQGLFAVNAPSVAVEGLTIGGR